MSTKTGTSTTLDLLTQYNNHIQERDKAIDDIEKKSELEDNRLSYDDLFKENVKLNLELKEREKEIVSLKKVINLMQNDKDSSPEDLLSKINTQNTELVEKKKEFVLPPRSTGRTASQKDSTVNESSPTSSNKEHGKTNPFSESFQNNNNDSQNDNDDIADTSVEGIETAHMVKINENAVTHSAASITSNHLPASQTSSLASPAASVTYTTSRITIKSPNRSQISPVPERLSSPQSINRVTSVINNQLHSPLKSSFGEKEMDIFEKSSKYSQIDSNLEDLDELNKQRSSDKQVDFSPRAKAKLDNFSQLVTESFGDAEKLSSPYSNPSKLLDRSDINRPLPPVPPNFFTPTGPNTPLTPAGIKLGSPVILNRNKDKIATNEQTKNKYNDQKFINSIDNQPSDTLNAATKINLMDIPSNVVDNSSTRLASMTTTTSNDNRPSIMISPSGTSQNSLRVSIGKGRIRANSTGTVASSVMSMLDSDIPLFVQSNDLGTIKMDILSTLYHDPQTNSEDELILFGVIDRSSGKEIFKFSKSIQKIRELDVYLKSHVSALSLPSLPERNLFQTTLPTKVDYRMDRLSKYFHSIFTIPDFPTNVKLKIAQFLSTDTVMSPFLLEDTVKEGPLLMRRPKKALGGTISWKVRYGILNGEYLQLLEAGDMMETIRLKQASLELLPNLPEDRYGTKNGFLLIEQKKGGLSTSSKYYICTETPKERESWISALSQFIDTSKLSISSPHSESVGNSSSMTNSSVNESTDQIYVTDLTQPESAMSFQNSQTHNIDNFQATSYDQYENSPADDDRDIKRNKMRSLFPFKKFTNMANNTLNSGGHSGSHHNTSITENNEQEKQLWGEGDTSVHLGTNSLIGASNYKNLSSQNVVFGSSIDKCLKLSSHSYQGVYEIPSVVYRCLEYLYKNRGIQEEGIFRLSGSSTLIKTLQEEFDREYDIDLCNYKLSEENPSNLIGVNTISGLLKLYLRNLPHLIVGDEQFLLFKKVVDDHHNDPNAIALEFRKFIQAGQVPHSNVSIMFALFELLTRINQNSKYNKMNLRNLCIVFSPTLNIPIAMLQPFIVDFNCIFKGEEPVSNEKREEIDIHIPGV